MADELAYTSVQALAEIIQARLEPLMRDSSLYEREDIEEEIRNAYAAVLYKIHMANMADGERTSLESFLAQKYYDATPDTTDIKLNGTMVINLPRDAGIYAVIAADKDKKQLGSTLTKSNPALATAPKSKIDPGKRYYRLGRDMHFPDGLPPCTAFILVTWYGLRTDDVGEYIQRDMADLVRDKVFASLFPTKQIQGDNTNQDVAGI